MSDMPDWQSPLVVVFTPAFQSTGQEPKNDTRVSAIYQRHYWTTQLDSALYIRANIKSFSTTPRSWIILTQLTRQQKYCSIAKHFHRINQLFFLQKCKCFFIQGQWKTTWVSKHLTIQKKIKFLNCLYIFINNRI